MTGLRWVAGGAGLAVFAAVVAWWPRVADMAPPVPPQVEEGFVFVPLDGSADEDTCVPMLDALVSYPRWELQINERGYGCMGSWEVRRVTIGADGLMSWRDADLPERHVMLRAEEVEAIRSLNRLDCALDPDRSDHGRILELGWGAADTTGGVRLSSDTEMGRRIDEIVDAAIARYTSARLAAVQPIELRLASRPYKLTVDSAGAITLSRKGRVVAREQLDPRALVDLVDAIVAGRERPFVGDASLRGSATIAGRRYPVVLGRHGEIGPFRRLVPALYYAED